MQVLPVNPDDPREDRVAAAVEVLSRGALVALPTETFYGVAGDGLDAEAMARVNRLKGKPGMPILQLIDRAERAEALAEYLPDGFAQLAARFWPGALTMIVPAASHVPETVTASGRTVALRVPGLALPRRIVAALDRPISGVSANLTGEPPSRTAAQLDPRLADGIELLLDGGATTGAAPSTIVDLTCDPPRVVREGFVPSATLRPHLPTLDARPVAPHERGSL